YKLLNAAWERHLGKVGPQVGMLANNRPFWYFANQHFTDNKIRLIDFSGKPIRRQLVGFSKKRRVFWHFGVQARTFQSETDFYFSLTPHVTFSVDGVSPLPSKAQLHTLRRSF